MLNFVIIQGNLTKDPELVKTKNDASVVNIRIACRRDARYTKQDADFIRLTFWDAQAELLAENYRKGDNITIIGRLEESLRTAQDGTRYNAYGIRVAQILNPESISAMRSMFSE